MAKVKLTKRIVDGFACPADETRATLFDSELTGFHVEAFPSGRKVYRFKWKREGRQGRETIGEHGALTVEQARMRATQLRAALLSGGAPVAPAGSGRSQQAGPSLAELIDLWLEQGRAAAPEKRESSWRTDERKLRSHIIPLLGATRASDLTRQDVEQAQQRIAKGDTASDRRSGPRGRSIVRGGVGVARSSILSLSSCLSWAVDRGILTENPCFRVRKPKGRKLNRFLSRNEAVRLLETVEAMTAEARLHSGFADIIRLLLFTGARKSEVQDLEWSEVDLERALITLPRLRSKTGERVIPLNSLAVDVLQRRRDHASPIAQFVFPAVIGEGSTKGVQKAWERVRAEAALPDVRLHDLRHSFASFAAANGASLYVIGKALGHSQPSTTARYAHLTADPVRDVAEDVAKLLKTVRAT